MVKITASEWWHCPFITPNSLIAYHLMTNSKWVTIPIFCQEVLSHLIPWPTASEWQCHFAALWQAHHISSHNKQDVSDTTLFSLKSTHTQQRVSDSAPFPSSYITSHDKQLVSGIALCFFQAVSLHLIQWPIGSELHWTRFFLFSDKPI